MNININTLGICSNAYKLISIRKFIEIKYSIIFPNIIFHRIFVEDGVRLESRFVVVGHIYAKPILQSLRRREDPSKIFHQ